MANELDLSLSSVDRLNASLNKLVESMDRVEASLRKISNSKPVFEQVFGTQAKFSALIDSIKRLDAVGVAGFVRLSTALGNLAEATRDLKVDKTVKSLVTTVVDLLDTLESKSSQFEKTSATVARFFKNISDALANIKSAPSGNASQILANFDILDLILEKVDKLEKAKVADSPGIKAVGSLFSTLQKLFKDITSSADIKPSQVLANFDILDLLLTNLEKLKTFDLGASESSIQILANFVRALGGIFNQLKTFSRNTKIEGDFIDSFKTILTSLRTLPAVITALPGIGSLEIVGRIFQQLGTAFSAFKNVFTGPNALSKADLKKIAQLFLSLSTTLKVLSALSTVVPGLQAFAELSKIFQKLGVGFQNLSNAARELNFNVVKRLGITMLEMAVVFRGFALVIKLIPGGGAFNTFATSLKNLGEGMSLLSRLGRDVFRATAISQALQDFVKIIKPFFFSLAAIRVKNLPDFKGTFAGLTEGLKNLQGVDFNSINLKGLDRVIREIGRSLEQLNNLDINPEKIKAAAAGIKSLAEVGAFKSKLSGVSEEFTSGIFSAVSAALLRNDIIGLVGSTLLEGFKRFNPVSAFLTLENAIRDSFRNISQQILETGRNLREFGENAIQAGQNLLQNFGLGALFQSGGFQAAVEFDKLSTQVQTFGRLTDEELESAQAFANTLGIQYPLSANEALSAILDLTKAGQDLADVQEILPSAADLAALSDTGSIEQSTALLIGAASAFEEFAEGVPAGFDNIAVAANITANTADATSASIEDINAALANIGPIAAQYGLNFADVNAIVGEFSQQQLKGAEAGTALRSALSNLNTNTAQNELKRLGVSLTDSEGNFRDFNDIIVDLNRTFTETSTIQIPQFPGSSPETRAQIADAQKVLEKATQQLFLWQNGLASGSGDAEKAAQKTAEYNRQIESARSLIAQLSGSQETANFITQQVTRSQEQNAASLKKIFGAYGQVAGSILIANGGFGDLREQILTSGTAAERAQLLLNNLAGDMEQLRGSAETLATRALLPLISRAFRPMVQVGRVVVDFFNSLSEPILETASTLIFLSSSFATLFGVLAIAGGVVLTVAGYFATLVGGIGLLLVNIVPLVVGITSIATAFITVVTAGGLLIAGLTAVSAAITAVFRVVEQNVGGAGDSFENLRRTISDILSSLGSIVATGADIFSGLFGSNLNETNVSLGERVAGFFDDINASLSVFRSRVQAFQDFMSGLQSFIGLSNEQTTRDSLFAQFSAEMPGAPEVVILGRVNDEIDKLKSGFEGFADLLSGDSFSGIAGAVGKDSKTLFERLIGRDVSTAEITGIFQAVQTGLQSVVDGLGQSTRAGASLLFDALGLSDLNDKELGEAQRNLETGLSRVLGVATRLLGSFTGLNFSDALLSFEDRDLEEGVRSVFTTLLRSINNFFTANRGKIIDALGSVFNFLIPGRFSVTILRFLGFDGLADQIESVFDGITDIFKKAIGTIFDLVGGQSLTDAILGNFGDGAAPVIRAFEAFGNMIGSIIDLVSQFFDILFPKGFGGENPLETFATTAARAFDFLARVFDQITNVIAVLGPIFLRAFSFFANSGLISSIVRFGGVFTGVLGVFSALGRGGFSAAVLNLFKSLGTVLRPLLAPLLAIGGAVVGLKSFLDALVEGGDIGAIITNTLSGFLSTVSEIFGLEISEEQINEFASTLGVAISEAIAKLPEFLKNAGDALGAPILGVLGSALETGDFSGLLQSFSTAISDAFSSVGQYLSSVGAAISSPILSEIGTALQTGDFSPVLQAISTAFSNAIQQFPGFLVDIGTALGAPLITEIGTALQTGDFQPVLNQIAAGIESALNAAGSTIATVGQEIGSSLLTEIGTFIQTGDFQPVLNNIGAGIQTAIQTAGTTLTTIGGAIGSSLITETGNALLTGDFTPVINNLLNGIVTAIGLVPELIISLGGSVGSELITAIGNALNEGDFTAASDAIITSLSTFLSGITGGIDVQIIPQSVIDGLNSLFAGINAPVLEGSVGVSFGTMLATLSTLPLGVITAATDAITSVVQAISEMDSTQFALFASSLLIIGTVAIVKNIGGVTTSLLSLGASLKPLAGVAAILVVIKGALEGVSVAIEQGSAGRGIGAALVDIGSTVLGLLGIDVNESQLVTTFNQFLTLVEVGIRRLAISLSTGVSNLIDGIANLFNEVIGAVTGGLGDLLQTLKDANIPGLSEGIQQATIDSFKGARIAVSADDILGDVTLSPTEMFDKIGAAFDQVANDPTQLAALERNLRTSFSQVKINAEALLPSISELTPDQLANFAQTLVGAGAFDEVLVEALGINPEAIPLLVQGAIDSAADGLTVDFSKIVEQISLAAQANPEQLQGALSGIIELAAQGAIDEGTAAQAIQDILTTNTFQNLGDSEALKAQVDAYLAALAAAIAAGGTDGAGVEVPVTPVPVTETEGGGVNFLEQAVQVVKDELSGGALSGTAAGDDTSIPLPVNVRPDPIIDSEKFKEDIAAQIALGGTAAGDDTSVAVPVAVEPTVGLDAVSSPEEAAAFALALDQVELQASEALLQLTAFEVQTGLMSEQILLLNTDLVTFTEGVTLSTTTASLAWTTHQTVVATAGQYINGILLAIIGSLDTYRNRLLPTTIETQQKLLLMAQAYAAFSVSAVSSLDLVIGKVYDLNFAIRSALAGLGLLITSPAVQLNPQAVPTGGNIPGRKSGGDVFRDRLYEVAEDGISELLKIGGRTYLIPGQNGTVIPPTTSPIATPAAASGGVGGSMVYQDNSTLNLEITQNPGESQEALANRVAEIWENRGGPTSPDVRRRLSLSGSSRS